MAIMSINNNYRPLLLKILRKFPFKVAQGIFYREWKATAECAEGANFEGVQQVVEQGAVHFVVAGHGFMYHFIASGAAKPAWKTLTAAFVGGKLKKVLYIQNYWKLIWQANN